MDNEVEVLELPESMESLIQRVREGENADQLIADMTEKVVRMVRGGKVIRKNKRATKKRLSAKQRAALRKARRKANTGSAKRKRKKSQKVRKRTGL